jgi:hypothetical protein
MMLNRKWILGSVLLSLIALVLFATRAPLTAAKAPQGNVLAYLPFAASQPPPPLGIYGRVTEHGTPAAGITIDLRFYNGSSWSTTASVTTDANGEYHFFDMPALAPGQRYAPLYANNEENTNRVASWVGFILTVYAAGADAIGGDMDIADIQLATPDSGAAFGFPATFTWHLRPATPGDSYEYNLFDYETGDPWFYTDPPLGYVNNYTLNGLPPNFQYETYYLWSVWAYGPGGSGSAGNYGLSYWGRWIAFIESADGIKLVTHPTAPVRNPITPLLAMDR